MRKLRPRQSQLLAQGHSIEKSAFETTVPALEPTLRRATSKVAYECKQLGGPGPWGRLPPALQSQARRAHPDEVADCRLHGGHGRGEVRNGFAVHLALLVHNHQVGDLLRHRLQDALDRACVKHRHRGV